MKLPTFTKLRGLIATTALLICVLLVIEVNAVNNSSKKAHLQSIKGIVTDSHSRPIVGATVYFIDSSTLDTSPITPANILDGSAETRDEPLEDIVNDAIKVKTLPKAVSDKNGKFAVKGLNSASRFYAFVAPKDTDHLPGGDASRIAFSPKAITKSGLQIKLSWATPSTATFIGTSACYVCHGAGSKLDVTSNKKHGHALMFHKPGLDTANQDSNNHAGSTWNDFINKFTLATDYKTPVAPATTIETLYFQEYSASQSNKFIIYENTPGTNIDPTTGKKGEIWLKAYLWRTAGGQFNVTLENIINPADPNRVLAFTVPLTMGGYLRQRLLLNVPGLKGLYRFISYQAFTGNASQGLMSSYDRTRKPFSETGAGGGGISDFFTVNSTPSKSVLTPFTSFAAKSNVNSCAVCHIGAGTIQKFTNPDTGEMLAHTVADTNGVYDLGGDGSLQDMGIGCEQCHGAGSTHRDANLQAIIGPTPPPVKGKKTPAVPDTTGKFIVDPQYLGADRAALICGRCHQEGGSPLDQFNKFPPPGISRSDYLTNYVSPTAKGTPASRLWQNQNFEKGGHQSLTYSNYLLSSHYRNARQLVSCDDCHDSMGDSTYRYSLKGDPDDSSSSASLCLKCHAIDVTQHVTQKTGSPMTGEGMKCIDCHMPRTGKGGAGRPGLLIATPTGLSSDANFTYWQNDQSSHIWTVPRKFDPGVAGQLPGGQPTSSPPAIREAMPVPYTNSCGTCHDASKLQFQAPTSAPSAPAP